MANSNPLPLIHYHHLTMPQQTCQTGAQFHSTLQTNNSNNWVNNNSNNNNDCHHLMKSNVLHEGKMVARDFLSTVRPYYLNAHPSQWTDLPVYPPHPSISSSSSSSSFQQPAPIQAPSSSHCTLHVMQISPHHVTVCPSLTPEGESAFSDRSSMTSSKVHDDGLQGHWDQGSMNDSARDSTAFPDDDDDYGAPTNWPPAGPHDGPLGVPRPPGANAASSSSSFIGFDDKEGEVGGEVSYKWDVYDILLDQGDPIKSDASAVAVGHVDMELCSVASNCDPDESGGDVDPEESPERGPIGDDGPKEPTKSSRQEGLSETELLCFLRLLDKRDRGCSVRYTIEQFVTCIPVCTDVENLNHRTAALSCVAKETYDRLMHLAPRASRRQVVHAMELLPFILKSMGESALTTTTTTTNSSNSSSGAENRTKVRLRRRSRSPSRSPSRSRSRSFSRRRRRENFWSPDRNRLRGGRRYSPSVGQRKTFPGRFPSGRGGGRGGGWSDFPWKREQRRTADGDSRSRRWEEGQRWRREFPRRSPHRLKRGNEATTGDVQLENGKRREKSGSGSRLLRKSSADKSSKTSSSPESGSIGEIKKEDGRKLPSGSRLQRKPTIDPDKTATLTRHTENRPKPSFSDRDLTSVGSIERRHDGPDDPGTDSPRPPGVRVGLLPTPGTTAYRAVMERAATTRLHGVLSRRSVSAESELF